MGNFSTANFRATANRGQARRLPLPLGGESVLSRVVEVEREVGGNEGHVEEIDEAEPEYGK